MIYRLEKGQSKKTGVEELGGNRRSGSRFVWIITSYYMASSGAPWAGKINQNTSCDWLPERARWSCLARSELPAVSREKNFPGIQTINRLVMYRTFSITMAGYWPFLFFFIASLWTSVDSESVHKYAKKELGQYPAILTEKVWSITYISRLRAVSPVRKSSKRSKRESVTHGCERGVQATMSRLRAVSSAVVGRQFLLAPSIDAWPSQVTLTVIHPRLLILRSSPQFLRKREAARRLCYVLSQSSADQQSNRKNSCKLA